MFFFQQRPSVICVEHISRKRLFDPLIILIILFLRLLLFLFLLIFRFIIILLTKMMRFSFFNISFFFELFIFFLLLMLCASCSFYFLRALGEEPHLEDLLLNSQVLFKLSKLAYLQRDLRGL